MANKPTLREQTASHFACVISGICDEDNLQQYRAEVGECEYQSWYQNADYILNLFLQSLKRVKPLGDEEQIELQAQSKSAFNELSVIGKTADKAHQNVIDQIEEMLK